ncbi:replication restart DNA helicase PriA [Desulfacinum hydrothermale DSM 13146]|uniref:Replication restart protein PriA n=1 Tax=Desulfacinum hydrothermale DSM 13146 TaxID=1121390 RepID=A0A1W1XF36_9BACT|nr:primosomal protein N' [Desulfacinum hydrothermale]SMC22374.1 replication restart DNA helicase PriA [Desulfacinum hydrothermale DSM 13146]
MKSDPAVSYAEVAIPNGPAEPLHYRIPTALKPRVQSGVRVLVPLGRREALGIVVGVARTLPDPALEKGLRDVAVVLDQRPVLPADLMKLCRWMASYYLHPLPAVLETALPTGLLAKPVVRYRLTEEGAQGLGAPGRSAPRSAGARALEEALKLSGAIPRKELRALPRGWKAHAQRLEEKGWIQRDYVWPAAQPSQRVVRMIHLVQEPPPERVARSPYLRSFLEVLLEAGGTCSLGHLRNRAAHVHYWVKKLQDEGFLRVEDREVVQESPFAQAMAPTAPMALTPDQDQVVTRVGQTLTAGAFHPFVLFGVTGSGKTEVYLALIERVLAAGRTALVLVPEIALSTQLEALFRSRFGRRLAVWHSGLSPGVRDDQWKKIVGGESPVVLGVRSAVFSPLPNLGLIVVDEEHDGSYKQDDRLRYHARDAALMRARLLDIPVLLGSATPSLQSIHHWRQGRYELLRLQKRVEDRPLPQVAVVDMRRHRGPFRILSPELQKALGETLEQGRQAILFLNRRGFATFFLCRTCGYVLQCPHCAVSVTYHQSSDRLQCHYCGWEAQVPGACPVCQKHALIPFGFGTERVEEECKKAFPDVETVRIDRDAVSRPGQLVQSLNVFRSGKARVLIGTQMVAKGHDFPDVTLVGVINADTALQVADFRSGETTVQLLLQVAGRAGRGDAPGRVLVQTYNPRHHAIQAAVHMDYLQFCEAELASRQELQYPPFTRMARLLVTAPESEAAGRAARQCAQEAEQLKAAFEKNRRPIALMGPAPAPIQKLKGRFRWNLYIKAWSHAHLQPFLESLMDRLKASKLPRTVHVVVDRDPLSSL